MSNFTPILLNEDIELTKSNPQAQRVLGLIVEAIEQRLETLTRDLTRTSPFDAALAPKIALLQGEIIAWSDIGNYIESTLLETPEE